MYCRSLVQERLVTSVRLKITTPLTLRPHSRDSHGNQTRFIVRHVNPPVTAGSFSMRRAGTKQRRFLRRGRRDTRPASARAADSAGEEGGGLQNCFAAISTGQLSEEAEGENCVDAHFLKTNNGQKRKTDRHKCLP